MIIMALHKNLIPYLCVMVGVAESLYHLVGTNNKKPLTTIQPYIIHHVEFQQQCFALCFCDLKCYSFTVEKRNLCCRFYNKSVPRHHLVSSPDTEYFTDIRDCQDWYDLGAKASGVYKVNWMGRMIKDVRCNMEIDGGGWLTFQRRFDGSVDFYNPGSWVQYKNGFGSFDGEFWLGNDLLHEITASGKYFVYVYAVDIYCGKHFSKYGDFYVEDESNYYRVHFNATLLTGTHTFGHPDRNLNNQVFSTRSVSSSRDRLHCASRTGPFWFNDCTVLYANGIYRENLSWWTLENGSFHQLKLISMEIMIKKI